MLFLSCVIFVIISIQIHKNLVWNFMKEKFRTFLLPSWYIKQVPVSVVVSRGGCGSGGGVSGPLFGGLVVLFRPVTP